MLLAAFLHHADWNYTKSCGLLEVCMVRDKNKLTWLFLVLSSIFPGNRPATEKKNRENGFSEKYRVCEALLEKQTEMIRFSSSSHSVQAFPLV